MFLPLLMAVLVAQATPDPSSTYPDTSCDPITVNIEGFGSIQGDRGYLVEFDNSSNKNIGIEGLTVYFKTGPSQSYPGLNFVTPPNGHDEEFYQDNQPDVTKIQLTHCVELPAGTIQNSPPHNK